MIKRTSEAERVLGELLEGNRRFRAGTPIHPAYSLDEVREIATVQKPKVAIVACSDSRVSPDIIFDQPLGTIFASRVPGNVASDSAKWMLEIALGEFHVPLVMVMGHSGCLAVGQLLDGDKGGSGGTLRSLVANAVHRAKVKKPADLYHEAIEENVVQTVEHLARELSMLRAAIGNRETSVVGAVYEMETGEIRLTDREIELSGIS